MPSSDTENSEAEVDEIREALLASIKADLGDVVVGSHIEAGHELWIRVTAEAWAETADYMCNGRNFKFFDWLSAIDWLPSPFGRSMDSEVDKTLGLAEATEKAESEMVSGYAGGDTRFQVLARVHSIEEHIGLSIKADVGEDLTVPTWTNVYPGANWHEREAHEMYGISFADHPGLHKLYLPGDFEGYPLRKDFPLLSRLVKPWPGIVDVEPMPATENPEDAS